MSFSSAPLETLCIRETIRSLRGIDDCYKLPLPPMVKNRIVNTFNNTRDKKFETSLLCLETPDWLETEEEPPHSMEFLNRARENALDFWDWTVPKPLPGDLYAFLMNQNFEYTSFFMENPTHFVSRSFLKCKPDTIEYRLCEPCFNRDMDYWIASYKVENTHSIWPLETCMTFLKDVNNWCANCITTPLFKIFDENNCRSVTNLHRRKRSLNVSNYSRNFLDYMHNERQFDHMQSMYHSDDDSDSEDFITYSIQHPSLPNIPRTVYVRR